MILVTIPGTPFRLESAANASLHRMRLQGIPVQITESYRTYETQRQRYLQYLAGGNFALRPGTSMHERGLAIDFGPASIAWLRVHGKRHGWFQTNPAEGWHWEYIIYLDQNKPVASAPVQAPTSSQSRKDDAMILWYATSPSSDGTVLAGESYLQPAGLPAYLLSQKEKDAYLWHNDPNLTAAAGKPWMPIRISAAEGDDIVELTKWRGMAYFNPAADRINPQLDGRVKRGGVVS